MKKVMKYLVKSPKKAGVIKLEKMGILKVYSCSCGCEVEPSEIGFFAECGAKLYINSEYYDNV